MGVPTNITGGDLVKLWRVANMHLPEIEAAYYSEAQKVNTTTSDADEDKYGPCHPWWVQLARDLEQALYHSGTSLGSAGIALNQAVDQFTHVDGSSAQDLNELGEQLDSEKDKQDYKAVDTEVPADYDGPRRFDPPWDWSEVHDD